MDALIWIGALLSLAGIGGLGWCILYVIKLRKTEKDDAVLRTKMQKAVLVNFAALAVSTIGLMIVVAGIFLS